MVRLTGDVAVAGHVAHPDVLHVGVDLRNTMISNHMIFDLIFDFLTPAVILQFCSPKIPFKIKEKMENIDIKSTQTECLCFSVMTIDKVNARYRQ